MFYRAFYGTLAVPLLVTALIIFFWPSSKTSPVDPNVEGARAMLVEACVVLGVQSKGEIRCEARFRERLFYFVATPAHMDIDLLALLGATFCTLTDPPGRVLYGLYHEPLDEYLCKHSNLGK